MNCPTVGLICLLFVHIAAPDDFRPSRNGDCYCRIINVAGALLRMNLDNHGNRN